MQIDRYTVKSQEALERAQRLARDGSHSELQPEHLFAALLEDREGTVAAVLSKLGVALESLRNEVEQALSRLPRVTGGASRYMSAGLRAVLDRAEDAATQLKDEYVSVEHLLLALASDANPGPSRAVLQRSGVTEEAVLKALTSVRGGQRVTDQSPEDKYQALTRYGRDLTAAARQGKLDPVIGRDDEIRRVI